MVAVFARKGFWKPVKSGKCQEAYPYEYPKMARQDAKSRICPLIQGPNKGAIAMTVMRIDIIWTARSLE